MADSKRPEFWEVAEHADKRARDKAAAQNAAHEAATKAGEKSHSDEEVLAFEEKWGPHGGAKEEAIRKTFGLPASRYYQLLNAAIDKPDVLRAHPQLVYRLREARDARTTARAERRQRRTR